jgi:hypothetical protein
LTLDRESRQLTPKKTQRSRHFRDTPMNDVQKNCKRAMISEEISE